MKLQTSIRNALKIAERIKRCNGLIGTPYTSHEALRIKRAWLFGSMAKGKLNPGDTDILLECYVVGWFNLENAKLQPKSRNSMGHRYALCAMEEGRRYLRSGLKMVRFHDLHIDGNFGDIAKTKIMIYPKNNLTTDVFLTTSLKAA